MNYLRNAFVKNVPLYDNAQVKVKLVKDHNKSIYFCEIK